MAVISLWAAPPPSNGCDGGGIEGCTLDPPGVVPVFPLPGTPPEIEDRLIVVSAFVSENCSLPSPVGISRCNGDKCTGEADFLLVVSPLPPREEFRGETLPVYN